MRRVGKEHIRKVEIRDSEEETCTCNKNIIVIFVDISKGTRTRFGD